MLCEPLSTSTVDKAFPGAARRYRLRATHREDLMPGSTIKIRSSAGDGAFDQAGGLVEGPGHTRSITSEDCSSRATC